MPVKLLDDFVNLFFPKCCSGCFNPLIRTEFYICNTCKLNFPLTRFHEDPYHNPLAKLFWGRTNIEIAMAFCYYQKPGLVQNIIHNMKYKGIKELGEVLGLLFGESIKPSINQHVIDYIIPVPLHLKKQRQRGYNQSDYIAAGLSKALQIPVKSDLIKRKHFTSSQTVRSKYERWENVCDVFYMQKVGFLKGKHVLLLDDVITTGATIEACASQLLLEKDCKVSIATIAFPEN